MRIGAVITLGVVALGLGRDPGCGGSDGPSSGLNAPCTREKDCTAGLVCSEGVCTAPDAGSSHDDAGTSVDAGPGDAADDGG